MPASRGSGVGKPSAVVSGLLGREHLPYVTRCHTDNSVGMEMDLRNTLGLEGNVLKDTEATTRLIVCLAHWPWEYQQDFPSVADHLPLLFRVWSAACGIQS